MINLFFISVVLLGASLIFILLKKEKKETMILKYDTKEEKECNDILVRKNKRCNCFTDEGYPVNDQQMCMKMTHDTYCNDYNTCKSKFLSYMSGSEPSYNPENWSDPLIEGSHNCYAYFLDDHIPHIKEKCSSYCKKFITKNGKKVCKEKPDKCNDLKPQPGDIAKRKGILKKGPPSYYCDNIVNEVLLDNTDKTTKKEHIKKVKFYERCPINYYKGAVVVHPDKTYHFYRQDKNGQFSHKQGVLKIENVDASDKPIWAPHLADRDYQKDKNDGINYTDFCSYFCIPQNYFKNTNDV
jgi:hypothetical protein